MKATSRISAPYAAAISIIAVAAPGDEPQTAVLPGSTCQRVSRYPSAPLAAITAMTTVTKIGQTRAISPTIVGGMPRAIMQPMIACAIRTRRWGTRNPPPATGCSLPPVLGGASICYSTGERLRTRWGHGLAVASLTCC